VAFRDVARTIAELGTDGPAWRSLFGPLVDHQDSVVEVALGDHRRVPHGLGTATRMVLRMLEQGSPLWHTRFGGDAAPALLTGVAAHAITQLPSLSSAGTALLLGSLAHGTGWPIPRGGSQAITDALVADLRAHGGRIDTDTEATSLGGLPSARAYIFDTTPRTLARVAGARLPERYRRALERATYGNAAAKVRLRAVRAGAVDASRGRPGGDRCTWAAAGATWSRPRRRWQPDATPITRWCW